MAQIEDAASRSGLTLSRWLSKTAHSQLLFEQGMAGIAEWEATYGGLGEEQKLAGERRLEDLLSQAQAAYDRDAAKKAPGARVIAETA